MWRKQSFETDCTVSVSHTFDDLSAHVDLDDDIELDPGDAVLVHGAPLRPAYGEKICERRRATVTKASFWERSWARVVGDLECLDLLEVDFTERRTL